LTEAHAGPDLGVLRPTRAPQSESIFSGCEHFPLSLLCYPRKLEM